MRLLLLMPLDQQHVDAAAGIFKALPRKIQEHTFIMPTFMEYLIHMGKSQNWLWAFFDAIVSAQNVYKTAEANGDDLIIVGNLPNTYKFDAIFNFQEIDETLPYKDNHAEKIKELVQSEEVLANIVNNLYSAEDSKFSLENCAATADFLTAYLDTDPQLDKIKAKYSDTLKFKEGLDDFDA